MHCPSDLVFLPSERQESGIGDPALQTCCLSKNQPPFKRKNKSDQGKLVSEISIIVFSGAGPVALLERKL